MSEPVMGWVVCRPRAARRVAMLAAALSLFGLGITAATLSTSVQAASDTTFAIIRPDRKSTRLNSSHYQQSRMPSSA